MTSQKYISVGDACERYGIGRTWIYELIRERKIRSAKVGARRLIDVAAADAYFDAHAVGEAVSDA